MEENKEQNMFTHPLLITTYIVMVLIILYWIYRVFFSADDYYY
jgi:hypothetical protein